MYGTRSQEISQFYLHTLRSSANGMNHSLPAFAFPAAVAMLSVFSENKLEDVGIAHDTLLFVFVVQFLSRAAVRRTRLSLIRCRESWKPTEAMSASARRSYASALPLTAAKLSTPRLHSMAYLRRKDVIFVCVVRERTTAITRLSLVSDITTGYVRKLRYSMFRASGVTRVGVTRAGN